MTSRSVYITVDPEACRVGLALLRKMAHGGDLGLGGAIDALAQVCAKAGVTRPKTDRHAVKVHMVRDHDPSDYDVVTVCGRRAQRALQHRPDITHGVDEATTPICNIIEVTADPGLVTCGRCLSSVQPLQGEPPPSGGAASSPDAAAAHVRGTRGS